jgi:DNA-binding MarR family transcriptional regulator
LSDEALSLAALNASLLEAIVAGETSSPKALAEAADIHPNHVHRKLASLLEKGLVEKIGDAPCEVQLTDAGRRALDAVQVFHSGVMPQGGETYIPFSRIRQWAKNPRTQFDTASTEDLAQSIADKGVLQPITVRALGDEYEVIIGERRRRAAALAVERGLVDGDFCIPCKVQNLSDEQAEEIAGVENIQREDMHWMDEARWFLKLSARLSAPSIQRLIGDRRGKRSIQDYIKCARELTPAQRDLTYLSDGHKDQLTYVKARDLVGEKKDKPALELQPRQAVAFAEILALGMRSRGIDGYAQGETIVTRCAQAPTGGPIGVLIERKLTVPGFDDRQLVLRTRLTDEICLWLEQIGFKTSSAEGLWSVRTNAFGDAFAGMYTKALGDGLDWATPELNAPPPAPVAAAPVSPSAVQAATLNPAPTDDAEAADLAGPGPSLASPPAPAAALALDEPKPMPPLLGIIVAELAHKIAASGTKIGENTWCAQVRSNYYKDGNVGTLTQRFHAVAMWSLAGDRTGVMLGKEGLAWLEREFAVELDAEGRPAFDDRLLAEAQERLLGRAQPEDGPLYSTFWLNTVDEVAPAPVIGGPADASSPPAPEPGVIHAGPAAGAGRTAHAVRDQFSQDIMIITAESRAWSALAAATDDARGLLSSLRTRAKHAAKPEELDPLLRRLEAALEAVAPFRASGHVDR